MLLIPIKNKFKKPHERRKNVNLKAFDLINAANMIGNCTLLAKEAGKITNKELESIRRILRRNLKKTSPIVFHIFPNTFITKKPLASRMGKGKGPVKFYAYKLSFGDTILEFKHNNPTIIKKIFKLIKSKIAIKTVIKYTK